MKHHQYALTLAALLAPMGLKAQSTSLSISNPEASLDFDWADSGIWDNGVPGPTDDVRMGVQLIEGDSPVPVPVIIRHDTPATIQSLSMDYEVTLEIEDAAFDVTGLFEGDFSSLENPVEGIRSPFFSSIRSQASFGSVGGYNALNGTLDSKVTFLVSSFTGGTAAIEWPGANIRHLASGINLHGLNSKLQDNSGLNALRNLERITGFLNLQRHTLSVTGNLVNDGEIIMGYDSTLHVAGNITGSGKFLRNDPGFARITSGGVTMTGITLELADTLEPADFEFDAPSQSFTNSTLNGSGRFKGNVTLTNTTVNGRRGGGRIEVTGNSGIIIQDSRLKQPTSGVDSFQLKALTQSYNQTSSSGNWTLDGTISYTGGSIHPGNSPGVFRVTGGDFTLGGNVLLDMELGGTTPATRHDVITQSGGPNGTTLAGELRVTFIDQFECDIQTSDSFTLLTSDRPLAGSFSNVASGTRLTTADGMGSFLVRYGPGSPAPSTVTLSDFQPIIVPETYAQWVTRLAIPAGQQGAQEDPNGDGIPNAVAFATGLSPVGPGQASPFTTELTPAGVVVSFRAPKRAVGLTVTSATSTNLTTWPEGPALTAVPYSALKNRYSFTLPLTGSDRRFGRFNITAAP